MDRRRNTVVLNQLDRLFLSIEFALHCIKITVNDFFKQFKYRSDKQTSIYVIELKRICNYLTIKSY